MKNAHNISTPSGSQVASEYGISAVPTVIANGQRMHAQQWLDSQLQTFQSLSTSPESFYSEATSDLGYAVAAFILTLIGIRLM